MGGEAGGQEASAPKTESVPWLAGMSGSLRVDLAGQAALVLVIHDAVVTRRPASGADRADAVLSCDSEELVAKFNRGELNPVVAMLQGRLTIEGDRAFAIKAVLGLQALRHPPPPSARTVDVGDQPGKGR
jgi:putative sterol carrier protein